MTVVTIKRIQSSKIKLVIHYFFMVRNSNILKQKSFFKYDVQLLIITVLLCTAGLAYLASSLNLNAESTYWSELQKQFLVGIVGGGLVAWTLARTDYHVWTNNRDKIIKLSFLMLGFVAFFSFLTLFKSTADEKEALINSFNWLPIRPYIANGAVRWIELPFNLPNIQPSELAKLTTLIYFAGYLGKNFRNGFNWMNLKKPLWVFGASAILILTAADLGSIAIIFAILMSAMLVAKVPVGILRKIFVIGVIVGFLTVIVTPYRLLRLLSVIQVDEKSAQVEGIQKALYRGGLWGRGYGSSMKIDAQIYEASTDSIIAVIAEETGFVGTFAFLILYAWLFYRGMQIASQAPDLEGKMLATGIVVWIGAQVFLNVCGMTGMIPMKGLPLPFVSKGGTAIVINLISIGILLNISSQKSSELRKV
jgi:cell division protein FtsW